MRASGERITVTYTSFLSNACASSPGEPNRLERRTCFHRFPSSNRFERLVCRRRTPRSLGALRCLFRRPKTLGSCGAPRRVPASSEVEALSIVSFRRTAEDRSPYPTRLVSRHAALDRPCYRENRRLFFPLAPPRPDRLSARGRLDRCGSEGFDSF